MMTIETRIDPVEINNQAITGLPENKDQVSIRAHWNRNSLVVIEFHNKSFTVSADKLERAIRNAKNH